MGARFPADRRIAHAKLAAAERVFSLLKLTFHMFGDMQMSALWPTWIQAVLMVVLNYNNATKVG